MKKGKSRRVSLAQRKTRAGRRGPKHSKRIPTRRSSQSRRRLVDKNEIIIKMNIQAWKPILYQAIKRAEHLQSDDLLLYIDKHFNLRNIQTPYPDQIIDNNTFTRASIA